MSKQASCAHIMVKYRTKTNEEGYITGCWECDSNCGMKFVPESIVSQLLDTAEALLRYQFFPYPPPDSAAMSDEERAMFEAIRKAKEQSNAS